MTEYINVLINFCKDNTITLQLIINNINDIENKLNNLNINNNNDNDIKYIDKIFDKLSITNNKKENAAILIQYYISKYLKILKNLPKNNTNDLNYYSINTFFNISTKNLNDKNNKIRENIISEIINNNIDISYYQYSNRWKSLKNKIIKYIESLLEENIEVQSMKCILKAGRKYNYDFNIIVNDKYIYNIEFKFNVNSVKNLPQFVSPNKPSRYINSEKSFEEDFYDNYLYKIANYNENLIIPLKEVYLKEVNSNKPNCMTSFKELYKQDDKFNSLVNKLEKEHRSNFVANYNLDIPKLNEYLKQSQENKIYMLYKDNSFYKEISNNDNYKIISAIRDPKFYRYKAETVSGVKLNILLRWKNGNGIAYPAFQISVASS